MFAGSLAADDVVALETTSGAGLIAEIIEPHVAAVVVANTRKLPQISKAKAKTDRLDARTLARLAASGFLETVWAPDQRTRALRRLCARREALVRARTRAKNEAHAVPARNLCGRPPVTDCFGTTGRAWLAGLQLPVHERLTLDGCLRQIDFLDSEISTLEAALAMQALDSPEILRLMSVPGVSLHTAAAFIASVGDIRRFASARQLVGYLGLDPRVRQSGNGEARHGRISKAGSSLARGMLGEAAWSVAQTPGPLRAFFERIRARKGPQVAATATARKLACLFWCLLTRQEDYAYARPSMTRAKIRRLELRRRRPAKERRARDRRQQERSDARGRARARPPRRDRLPAHDRRLESRRPHESGCGCGRDTGARIFKALEGQSRATDFVKPQTSALRYVSHPHPTKGSHQPPPTST